MEPEIITLEEYRRLTQRPASARQAAPSAPKSPNPGEYTNRIARAAANGWHALESDDAVRYRWRVVGGAVTPWMPYPEATAYGAAHRPDREPGL